MFQLRAKVWRSSLLTPRLSFDSGMSMKRVAGFSSEGLLEELAPLSPDYSPLPYISVSQD